MLSRRLETIIDFCGTGHCAADIGTDHGFVPIELVLRGKYKKAIAMDVRQGPLARAAEHIREKGLAGSVEVRLSDGLRELAGGEADTIVIAGMGGGLMREILSEGSTCARSARRLVLSPQSDIPEFRQFLHQNDFSILREEMLEEDGKYYVVMEAAPGRENLWTEEEYLYGRDLLRRASPVLMEKLRKDIRTDSAIAERLTGSGEERKETRRRQILDRKKLAEQVLERMERSSP